jgi:hypothetical protein
MNNSSESTNLTEPSSEMKTLENKIFALIAGRLGGQVLDAKLQWRDNFLVIQGRAKSYYVKQIAQQIVLEVIPGHQSLINEIEVS